MNTTSFWALRHAPVQARGLCYGWHEAKTGLSAEEAAERVLAYGQGEGQPLPRVEVVWSSPLQRCASLASVLATRLGATLALDPDLREIHFGEWEGRLWSAIEAEDAARMQEWMTNWQQVAPPGGESLPEFTARIERWWRLHAHKASTLLVAHAGVLRALEVLSGSLDWEQAMAREVPSLRPARFALPATSP